MNSLTDSLARMRPEKSGRQEARWREQGKKKNPRKTGKKIEEGRRKALTEEGA